MYLTHTHNGYKFTAKVYTQKSKYGIVGGKVSKLTVWNPQGQQVFNYDRGLDFIECPKSVIKQIVHYCESPLVQLQLRLRFLFA